MAAVDLTPYDARATQIAQQQKLAQLLAQQAQAPIEVGSYKGIQAPIAPTQGINKILQSVLAAYDEKKSKSDADTLTKDERDTYLKAISDPAPVPPQSAPAPPPQAAAPPPAPMPPPPPGNGPAIAAALSGGPAPPAPMPSGPDPTAGPDPTQAPSTGPAIAATLSGPQPQAPPPAQPMPTLPSAPAPVAAQAPPPTPADAPVAAAPPDPMQARLAAAHAALQKARLTAAQFIGTPYAKPAAEAVTSAEEQVKKLGDLQDASAQKEADRAASVQRAQHFIADVPGLDDNARKTLIAGATADPDTAKAVVAAMVKDAFTHKLVPAGPQDLQGYPQGTIAQKDPYSGKLENIYNPVPNLMAIANEKLHAQEVGISGARLNLERQKFAFDKDQKTNAVLDPSTVSQMAQQALAGDPSVLQSLGRGAQGAQNIVAVRTEMYRQAQARGMKPEQIAAMNARFFGEKAEARAAGTRAGATDVATSEVPGLAQEALAAHAAIPTANLVPYNRAVQMVQAGTSSPELARAVVATQGLTNAYARSYGTGATSDHARHEAQAVIQNAWGTPAFTAAISQIQRNTQVERHGARAALDVLGSNAPAPMPAPLGAAHAPYADPGKEARYQAWLKAHGQ